LNSAGRAPKCRPSGAPHLVASVGGCPPKQWHQRSIVVLLIVYYVVFMIAGDLAAYIIGLLSEREFGGQVSLIVFLALYFLFWAPRKIPLAKSPRI
jgi:hypothetical protein